MKYILLIASLLFSVACFAKTPVITQQQLLENQMSDNAYTIIDVRSVEEFNDGHVKGALNIPHDQINENISVLESLKDKTLVVYCRSGRRAGLFEKALSEKGFKLKHLEGDYLAWSEKQLPLIKK